MNERNNFRFVHAADLHLDSPFIGLSMKSEDLAEILHTASRQAFDNLVDLAINEECDFVVISGDIFDGDWRDYRTGLFFVDRMRKLEENGIEVFLIKGNHDAENRFMARLELSKNVHLFSSDEAETVKIEPLRVAVHGMSFGKRDVTDNLVSNYPPPLPNYFNVGLLHTACSGREGHAKYAPCSEDQLTGFGYEYWALGHVHTFEEVSTSPHVVYSGNLQGRSIKETGEKGVVLVSVDDGTISDVRHVAVDVIRWATVVVDASGLEDLDDVRSEIRAEIDQLYSLADGRGLALRIELRGKTKLNSVLRRRSEEIAEEVEMIAVSVGEDIWVESLKVNTQFQRTSAKLDVEVVETLLSSINNIETERKLESNLNESVSALKSKVPAFAVSEEEIDVIAEDALHEALELVRAYIEGELQNTDATDES